MDGADEMWLGGVVAQRLADLGDQVDEILFHDEGIRPEVLLQRCLGECFGAVAGEHLEQLKRLR